jgi:hypothetical protein
MGIRVSSGIWRFVHACIVGEFTAGFSGTACQRRNFNAP